MLVCGESLQTLFIKDKYLLPTELKSFPELNKAVLKTGDETVYRLWLLLRSRMVGGQQYAYRTDVLQALNDIGLGRTAWNRLLLHPQFTIYFTHDTKNDRIFLNSLKNLCKHYNCFPGIPVLLPLESLFSIGDFRAELFGAQFDADGRMVGRSTLEKESGVSPTTQRRYMDKAGIESEENFVFARLDDESTLPIPEGQTERRENGHGYVTTLTIEGKEEPVIIWQSVNRYSNKNSQRTAIGMSRKIARSLRCPIVYGDRERQRYFVDGKKRNVLRGLKAIFVQKMTARFSHHPFSLWQHFFCA